MKKALSLMLCAFMAISSVAFADSEVYYANDDEAIMYEWEELVPDATITEEVIIEEEEVAEAELMSADDSVQIMATVSTPKISFTNVLAGVQIDITCATSGTTIYYTTDGTTPTNSSEVYDTDNRPVLDVAGSYTVKAIAYSGSSKSSVATGTKRVYDCGIDLLNTGSIIDVRVYKSTSTNKVEYLLVSLNDVSSSYSVFYTTGTSKIPDTSSNPWNGSLKVTKPTRINFRIYRTGYAPTVVASQYITHADWGSLSTVEMPNMLRAVAYGYSQITYSCATDGATIRYAMSDDKSKVTGDLTMERTSEYKAPIRMDREGTYYFKAYAVKDGSYDSEQTKIQSFTITKTTAPTVSVNGSNTSTIRTVTVTKKSSDDVVFYTTDGSTPTATNGKEYTGSVSFGKSVNFKAVAVSKGNLYSDVITKEVIINNEKPVDTVIAPPVNSVKSVAENGAKTIAISCETAGAKIYYKLQPYSEDAKDYNPTTSDSLYSAPFTISQSGEYILYSRAYVNGKYSKTQSNRIAVTITSSDITQLEAPTTDAKTLSNGIKTVSLLSLEGSKIYYTVLDGLITDQKILTSEVIDETEEYLYSYPITVTKDSTILRYAVYINENGTKIVSKRNYSNVGITNGPITPDKVPGVTMSTAAEAEGTGIYLGCADAEADIFYVFDSNPSTIAKTTDNKYTRGMPIIAPSAEYLHVTAARPGYEFTSQTFSLNINKAAAPQISFTLLGGTTYTASFTSDTPNAAFYYTTDGSTPTTSSNAADDGFAIVKAGDTIKVIAVASGFGASDVTTRVVGQEQQQCKPVTIDVSNVMGGKQVTLSTMTSDALIYYTTDGSNPSLSGVAYSDSFVIGEEGTFNIRAVAKRDGYTNSDITEKEIAIEKIGSISGQLQYTENYVNVKLTGPENAKIYYTLDGSIPTEESERYSGVFKVTSISRLYAIAIASGYAPGPLFMATITPPDENAVWVPTAKSDWAIGGRIYKLYCGTSGADIYYSVNDGDDVLYDSSKPLVFTGESASIKMYACKSGMKDSRPATFPAVNFYKAEMPTASIASNTVVEKGTKVTLITEEIENQALSGSNTGIVKTTGTIYYTLDGSEPTLDSAVYSEPITINGATIIRAAVADMGYTLSYVASFSYTTEGGDLSIDTSGLERNNNLISGTVKVNCSKVAADGGKVIVAVYSNGEMLRAVSADYAEEVTFEGIEVVANGSVFVKAFVFDSTESLTPLCESVEGTF